MAASCDDFFVVLCFVFLCKFWNNMGLSFCAFNQTNSANSALEFSLYNVFEEGRMAVMSVGAANLR